MIRAIIVIAAMGAMPGAAVGGTPPPGFVQGMGWAEKPSAEDLVRQYPRKARMEHLGGQTVIVCRTKRDGRLTGCQVAEEAPEGYGFGQAALAASRYFRLTQTLPDGPSIEGGVVGIPMSWALPDGLPAPLRESYTDQAMLLVDLAADSASQVRTLPCPSVEAPSRHCPMLYWKVQPSVHDFEPIVGLAGDVITTMECTVDALGALSDCAVDGSLPAEAQAALITQASAYQAYPEATDKTPSAGKRMRFRYNWKAIRRYLDVHRAVRTGK